MEYLGVSTYDEAQTSLSFQDFFLLRKIDFSFPNVGLGKILQKFHENFQKIYIISKR